MERKRILNLHWGFALGGITKYVIYMDRVSEQAQAEMYHICIARKGLYVDEAALAGMRSKIILISGLFDLSWTWRLKAAIREIDPDYLMAHAFNALAIAWVARRLMGVRVPLLATFHGGYYAPTVLKKLVSPVYNGIAGHVLRRHARAILTVSNYSATELADSGVDSEMITVVHNGIPEIDIAIGTRSKIRAEWGIGEDATIVLAASQLIMYKGVDHLIDGFASLAEQWPDTWLVILGMGSSEQDLRNQVSRLGLDDRIQFKGMRDDVADCLEALDIFVLPSLFENHSIAILEAMRAGKAIISSDVGGNTESIRHECEGLIVPPANSGAISAALERLLQDPSLAESLGDNARTRFMQEFTQEIMLNNMSGWLGNVVD